MLRFNFSNFCRTVSISKARNSIIACLPRTTILLSLLFIPGIALSINNDALPDFVFANHTTNTSRVCLENGLSGVVCADVSGDPPDSSAVALGDVNEDGNLDAVFANISSKNRVCFGNGRGNLNNCIDASSDSRESNDVALGDVNNDGNLDAVFANSQANQVCLGDGRGNLDDCSNVNALENSSFSVALGDVNNDGDLDALFANAGHQTNRVCLGDGTGHFNCNSVSSNQANSANLALGDVNNDGNLDVVFSNTALDSISSENHVCFGNGAGRFTCTIVSVDQNDSFAVALGDINEDGNLDALFANVGINRLCLGNGSGLFTNCSYISMDDNPSYDVELSDINGDLYLDAVFANSFQPNRICKGDGTGSLDACTNVSADANNSLGLAVSRTGPYCSSGVRTVTDLRNEVGTLKTSLHSKNQLNNRLDKVEMALEDGAFDLASERVDGFISEAISIADVSSTPDANEITLHESNSLVCGATNLIKGIPDDLPTLKQGGRR